MGVNDKISAGKRTWALNICYFQCQINLKKENLQIEYFPTDDMWEYFEKSLVNLGTMYMAEMNKVSMARKNI